MDSPDKLCDLSLSRELGIGPDTAVEQLITIVVAAAFKAVLATSRTHPLPNNHAPPCALTSMHPLNVCFAPRTRRMFSRDLLKQTKVIRKSPVWAFRIR
jgi:hypothetical protein